MNVERFIQIKNKLLKEKISSNAYKIFCILLAHSKNGICYPSIRKIAEEYSMSKTTVTNGIKELEEKGIILKENRVIGTGKKTSNCYYLNEKFIVTKKELRISVPGWFGNETSSKEATDAERAEIEALLEEYTDE